MLGKATPTNGTSEIIQTFTAPTGKTKLSVWYANFCTDSVTYDWATAVLKDNSTGKSHTFLAKTCASSSAWKNVTTPVTAGHSYTLTLENHDDNYPGDPTYTLYDDVTLQ
jgi:serine protease